ncbi:hypothetical protein E2C01_078848 [Portunus trituberculatus]|uniref:Uncharacterized protein n=1 Tax=Portunus trituberculatus TaxID=210409 RepID=A0A5B7IFG0_PORTR|nr:hypothetical protein [Portunus trituberculatus]
MEPVSRFKEESGDVKGPHFSLHSEVLATQVLQLWKEATQLLRHIPHTPRNAGVHLYTPLSTSTHPLSTVSTSYLIERRQSVLGEALVSIRHQLVQLCPPLTHTQPQECAGVFLVHVHTQPVQPQ